MLYINLNGSAPYPPIQNADFGGAIPEGWAVITDEQAAMFYEYNGFVSVEVTNGEVMQISPLTEEWEMWNAEREQISFAEARDSKLQELSAACNAAITAGCDVVLSDGETHHFSLAETDQINISTATLAIQQGVAGFPYHADGELCTIFSAADILAVSNAAASHKTYHTTYCNHLLTWVRRTGDADELSGIAYGAELPDDLAANMAAVLQAAAGGAE